MEILATAMAPANVVTLFARSIAEKRPEEIFETRTGFCLEQSS